MTKEMSAETERKSRDHIKRVAQFERYWIAMTREHPGYHQGALLRGEKAIKPKERTSLIKRRQRVLDELQSAISGESTNNGERQTRVQIRASSTSRSNATENSPERAKAV